MVCVCVYEGNCAGGVGWFVGLYVGMLGVCCVCVRGWCVGWVVMLWVSWVCGFGVSCRCG